VDEFGTDETGRVVIRINPKFYRPAEVDVLVGNPTKALKVLGWTPLVTFEKLVSRMMAEDNKTHTD
jgi:GDPmannose 4,6-dehydratase